MSSVVVMALSCSSFGLRFCSSISSNTNPNTQKASSALQALGFKVKEADKMLNAINDDTLTTEELIRLALQNK